MQSKKIPNPFNFEVLLSSEEYADILTALWIATRCPQYREEFKFRCTQLANQFERGLTK
jgi:hypothetical protein